MPAGRRPRHTLFSRADRSGWPFRDLEEEYTN